MEDQSVNLSDLSIISQDELQQEYKTLFRKYKELLHSQEENKQTIYALKRNLQNAIANETYLNQEMELAMSNQSSQITKLNKIHSAEIEQWKQKYADLADVNATQEKFSEKLQRDNSCLKQKLQELELCREHEVRKSTTYAEPDTDLENINLDLLSKIDDLQFKLNEYMLITADKEKKIDYMKEKMHCLEENLKAKREEISEKDCLLESLQERLAEVNTELASYKTQPEGENRKGNSLFAEVDDQRQAMRNILSLQKRQFLQMQSLYSESKNQIKRLKRENAAMQEELRACSSLFLFAERTYKDKLKERIVQLVIENEKLEKKLRWTEDKIINVSRDKPINWIDSMIALCRKESEELKTQLRSCHFDKCSLEHNLMESQKQEAKWRFEALKSRCIIIDREYLLDEHGIKFRKANEIHCNITTEDCENAIPQITSEEPRESTKSPDETEFVYSKKLSKNKTFKHLSNVFNGLENKPPMTQDALNIKTEIDVCNVEHLNRGELNETSGNSVKKEQDNEISQVFCIGDIKKENTKESLFEIFKENVEHPPAVEFFNESMQSRDKQIISDIFVPEDAFRKMTDIGHVNCAGQRPPVYSKNSADIRKFEFSHAKSCFQVYEDTTQHLPLEKDEPLNCSNGFKKENLLDVLDSSLIFNELSTLQAFDSRLDCVKETSISVGSRDNVDDGLSFVSDIEYTIINNEGNEETSNHSRNKPEQSDVTITRITIG